jgi:hypothetical protein
VVFNGTEELICLVGLPIAAARGGSHFVRLHAFCRTLTTQNTKRIIRKQTSRSVPEATLFLLSLRLVSCRLNIRAPFWIACLNYEAKCGTRVDAVNPPYAVTRMIRFQPKMDVAKIRQRKEPHHGDAYSSLSPLHDVY